MNILFVTEFGRDCGFGHLSRCKNLALSLTEHINAKVYIQSITDTEWPEITLPFIELISKPFDQLKLLISKYHLDLVIIDLRQDYNENQLSTLADIKVPYVTIDDLTPRRIKSKGNLYPPIPQVDDLDWKGFHGINYIGWDYYVLNSKLKKLSSSSYEKKKLLISLGGSDAFGLERIILKLIPKLITEFNIDFVVGPLSDGSEIEELRNKYDGLIIHHNPHNFIDLLGAAQIALVTYGVTVYELAFLEVPTLIISTCNDHKVSGKIFWEKYSGFCHVPINSNNFEGKIINCLNNLNEIEKHTFPVYKAGINNNIINIIRDI